MLVTLVKASHSVSLQVLISKREKKVNRLKIIRNKLCMLIRVPIIIKLTFKDHILCQDTVTIVISTLHLLFLSKAFLQNRGLLFSFHKWRF